MREYLEDKETPSDLRHELNSEILNTLRKYLCEFWRHEVEKNNGKIALWKKITGISNNWWEEENNNNNNSSSSSSSSSYYYYYQTSNTTTNTSNNGWSPWAAVGERDRDREKDKTRWVEVAECFFSILLELDYFDQHKHRTRLEQLSRERSHDSELLRIIQFYLKTLG